MPHQIKGTLDCIGTVHAPMNAEVVVWDYIFKLVTSLIDSVSPRSSKSGPRYFIHTWACISSLE